MLPRHFGIILHINFWIHIHTRMCIHTHIYISSVLYNLFLFQMFCHNVCLSKHFPIGTNYLRQVTYDGGRFILAPSFGESQSENSGSHRLGRQLKCEVWLSGEAMHVEEGSHDKPVSGVTLHSTLSRDYYSRTHPKDLKTFTRPTS